MTEETEYDGTETDWLANSYLGYGFGYTKEQALQEMAANVSPSDDPIEVDLIEHVGNATVSPSGSRVETFVSGERIEVSPEDFEKLRDAAIKADVRAESITDDPESFIEELEG